MTTRPDIFATHESALLERIVTGPRPSLGVVIGTYGSVPYVHLHLESWRRYYPDVPLLVHDDASSQGNALRALCRRYGAEFSANPSHYGHGGGDLTAYVAGLEWAEAHGLELLVKLSRRFVPRLDWVRELQTLAYVTQYATYSNTCTASGYGFRTDCLALHVLSWTATGALAQVQTQAQAVQGQYCFVEPVMHNLAKGVHRHNCLSNKLYETLHPTARGSEGYGRWAFMESDRLQKHPQYLWHDTYTPFEYYLAAVAFGITEYEVGTFEEAHD